jgi:hypothetical protein
MRGNSEGDAERAAVSSIDDHQRADLIGDHDHLDDAA